MRVEKTFRMKMVSKRGKEYWRKYGKYHCNVHRNQKGDIVVGEILFDWDNPIDGIDIPKFSPLDYRVTHGGRLFRAMQFNFPTEKEMVERFLKLEHKGGKQ